MVAASYSIDIDTGGTFTDGLVLGNGRAEKVKVDTTPHDLTAGFFECIKAAAGRLGFDCTNGLLGQTRVIRLSTTIGTNTLLQQSGPKLGLIVSAGNENTGYAHGDSPNPAMGSIIEPEMVVGVVDRAGGPGNAVEETGREEVRRAVKELLVRGARAIVVSVLDSHLDPAPEKRVRDVIYADYPTHYLSSVPVVLGTEISASPDNMLRTNAALVNTYIHRDMVRFLYKADEALTALGYPRPLLIVHNSGSVARVAKTRAINTLGSGPSAALFGAARLAGKTGTKSLLTMDVGGTSTDLGLIVDGKVARVATSVVEGIPVGIRTVETLSIAAGGGTVAAADAAGLKIGSRSAGALPGPACFGLGGEEATVTDAGVVLGYINPDYFLGGRKKLNPEASRRVIHGKLARPLNGELETVSRQLFEAVTDRISRAVRGLLRDSGAGPGETALLSFGGAGGLFCAAVARQVGIPKIYISPLASVFSAFGSSTMEVAHEYECPLDIPVNSSHIPPAAVDKINRALASMRQNAERDMKGEGFPLNAIHFAAEIELKYGRTPSYRWLPLGARRMERCEELRNLLGHGIDADGFDLKTVRLRASCPGPHADIPVLPPARGQDARKGERRVYWDHEFENTPVYEMAAMAEGDAVAGPAILESEDTTVLVPRGCRYLSDNSGLGVIEES